MSEINTGGKGLSVIRGVLEAIIVAALLWTGSSLVDLKVDNGVLKSQLNQLLDNTSDLPSIRKSVVRHDIEITALKEKVKELEQVKNLK